MALTWLFPYKLSFKTDSLSLEQRIRIEEIRNDEWFKRSYVPVRLLEYEDVNLDDVNAVFDDAEVGIAFHSFPLYQCNER